MNSDDILKVLDLIGFKQVGATYTSYQVVPFVGNIPFKCMEMRHDRKIWVLILTEFSTLSNTSKQNRVVKFGHRWNKKQMDTVRKYFPETDSLAEVANTLEVCP